MEQVLKLLRIKGYEANGVKFPTGRSDRITLPMVTRKRLPVVAKFYPTGGGEITFSNMQELWRSSFGEGRRPPGLPRPIEYLDDAGVLIMERVEGRPFVELDPLDINILDDSIRLAASLHQCNAQPGKRRDSRLIVKSVRRKAESISKLAPKFAETFWTAVEALEAAQVKDLELVPCHGDFSPKNVLVAPNGLVLLDWDRFRLADAARDIAYMGCWYWVRGLRQEKTPDWSVLDRIVNIYNSLRPGVAIDAHLSFHISAGLLRRAHSYLILWKEESYLVPQLIREALCQLR